MAIHDVDATEQSAQTVRDNWLRVSEQVQAACDQAGRPRSSVQVVGVSKYVGAQLTQQLFEAGCHVLGENRPQQLWAKAQHFNESGIATELPPAEAANTSATSSQPSVHWHMIGHLQRNKARNLMPHINYLHSLDSIRLAQATSDEALRVDRRLPVLAEVNVTRDESKTGLREPQLHALLEQLHELPGLELRGLMAMSTHHASSDEVRREFERVRQLRDRLAVDFPAHDLSQLSMGMSGDFAEAIAEGATLVRIGSSLWQGILPR